MHAVCVFPKCAAALCARKFRPVLIVKVKGERKNHTEAWALLHSPREGRGETGEVGRFVILGFAVAVCPIDFDIEDKDQG